MALVTRVTVAVCDNLIMRVNVEVNKAIQYQCDFDDEWDTTCPKAGDCEDYALCKARKLLEAGVAPHRMELVNYTQPSGVGHLVLVVNGLVLDNLTNGTVPVESLLAKSRPNYGCMLSGERVVYVAESDGSGYRKIKADQIGATPKCVKALRQLGV